MQFLALGYIFVHRRCNIGKQGIYVTLILCLSVISYMLFLLLSFFCAGFWRHPGLSGWALGVHRRSLWEPVGAKKLLKYFALRAHTSYVNLEGF